METRLLIFTWVALGAITSVSAMADERVPSCFPIDKEQGANQGQIITKGLLKDESGQLEVTVFEKPGNIVQVIVKTEGATCIRYELRDVVKTDPSKLGVPVSRGANCTEKGQSKDGIPSCDTVREFAEKVKDLNLRHLIEGTEKRMILGANQPSEVTRVQLGFCAGSKERAEETVLCLENIYKKHLKNG